MSFTVFLGNLPAWVTADDIKGWLTAESLVADAIKVIRNPETQESKGFAFIDAPNHEEMNAIIRRFDRAPLEDRLLRANPAQPPKPRGPVRPTGPSGASSGAGSPRGHAAPARYSNAPVSRADPPAHGDPAGHSDGPGQGNPAGGSPAGASPASANPEQRPPRRGKKSAAKRSGNGGPQSAFAEELAKVL
jgi:RNA recognition motif-containing protein